MSKELVIGSNRHETKVAILEDDQLVEVYFQRGNEYSLAGSIHKGRVTRVLPGMQSAFVDLGLERDTFLYVSDFFEENEDIDTVGDEIAVRPDRRDQRRANDRGPALRALPERAPVEHPIEDGGLEPLNGEGEGAGINFAGTSDEGEGSERSFGLESSGGSERPEGEASRGDRGGDRGRRGRRRRPRGRGFPENKYAQPATLAAPAGSSPGQEEPAGRNLSNEAAPARTIERLPGERISGGSGDRPSFDRAYADRSAITRISTGNRPENRERTRREEEPAFYSAPEPSDVIILPGESLAKYRRPAVTEATAKEEALASPEAPPETASSTSGYESKASFEEPAAEVAGEHRHFDNLAFPVHDATPEPLEHEAQSDEIPVADLAAENEAINDEAEELELADRVFAHHELEEVPEEEKLAEIEIERVQPAPEPSSSDITSAASHDEDELPTHHEEFALPFESTSMVDVISPVVVVTEPLTTFEASAPFGMVEQGDEEELDADADPAASDSDEMVAGEARVDSTPQTANLRDTSGRPLHRSSRRSRRRRGGQRPGGALPALGDGAATALPSIELAMGTAPAAEPIEVRRELAEARPERAERVMPSISDLLKAGQEIIVQIAKEPLGQKGARITSHIALPGRYVVFMPSVTHLGVSRKVASDEERQRLKQVLQRHRVGTTGGFIVRTAGEGVPEDEIAADMNFLYNLWLDIRQKAEKKPAPALLHYDLDIVQRILRDHVTDEYKAIWVDSEDMYESVLTFMQRFQPTLVSRVKMYTRESPIFDAFNITQELEKALRPKVWLKSGGYIVINQTEALVAIDINTGKYVGKSNRLEDTIVKTNTEAVKEIVRQIRLRDLGGIIVVDFIDMDERKNRQKVMAALEEAMESDKAPYKILQFNDFGLVAITRKRVKQSLERTLCAPCPYCEGAGYVKSVQTTVGEILVEAQKIARAIDGKDVVLRVHPEVAKVLKASNNKYLEEIEEILKRPVLVTGDPTLHTEKFDLA